MQFLSLVTYIWRQLWQQTSLSRYGDHQKWSTTGYEGLRETNRYWALIVLPKPCWRYVLILYWSWRQYLSVTMIKLLPLDFLGVSHRILWKNENSVYRLQIPAIVPEIFKFEKCLKYANEMVDDVIYSTQYYIKSGAIIDIVPEMFKFAKCLKYANEMADDVIYWTP